MTPHDLLANFEVLAEAPNGIQRLRELVLELAVRGKLVEQDPGDESASAYVKQIAAEKMTLVKQGRLRNHKASQAVPAAEVPFLIPSSWIWVRTEDAFLVVTDGDHQPPPKAEFGIPFLVIGNVSAGKIDFAGTRFVPQSYFDDLDWTKQPLSQDILYTVTGSYGIVVEVGTTRSFCVQRHIAILKTPACVFSPFLALALKSPNAYAFATSVATGTAQKTVPLSGLRRMPIPMPPLAEQRRIVARVDELMALLDRLEAKRQEREAARSAARDSALAALREAPTSDDVEIAWLRIQERFHELFATPEDVASLRQAVLQLAVSGRLVERDPDCTGAEALLDAIRGERRLMVKSGLIKVPKPCAPLADDELPFHPPIGWVWCRLGDLVSEGPTNGWSPTTVDYPTEVKTLALSATTKGWFDASRFKYVDAEVPSDSPLWLLPGDLLIQRSNTRDYVGMPAVFNGAPGEFIYPDLMMRCRFPASVSVPYVHLFLLSTYGRSFIQSKASGTSSSMVKVGQEVVRSIPVALPPAEEQLRILEAMNNFNRALDRLAASLNEATGLSDGFAAAAVQDLDA